MTILDRAEQFLRYAGPVVDAALGGPERRARARQDLVRDDVTHDAQDPPPADVPPDTVPSDTVPPELILRALPDVARSAATVLWRTTRWTLNATLRAGNIVVEGTISGQSADAIAVALAGEARQSLLGLVGFGAWAGADPWDGAEMSLSERMNALLDASADVGYAESRAHPAYVRLLSELTPDEARILRLFAERGPQPAVDVRTRKLLGAGSRLVTPGLTMIARYAGCRNAGRVPGYLDNMSRLGLIRFADDPLADHSAYDVLEAQEEVKSALASAGRGMTVRRRIELTVFGGNLCAMTGLMPAASPETAANGSAIT